jgi:rubrerythrin
MLAGNGFEEVYNLSGGIKAWQREVAVGPEDTGMYLFSEELGVEEAIVVGYNLEEGLRDFYLHMQSRVEKEDAKKLLGQLAAIEIIHQEWLVELYSKVTGTAGTVAELLKKTAEPVMEGGLTTDEYLQRYNTDLNSELEILSLAMAIEAQALDLYQRAAAHSENQETKEILQKIALEERSHLAGLSNYIDKQRDL